MGDKPADTTEPKQSWFQDIGKTLVAALLGAILGVAGTVLTTWWSDKAPRLYYMAGAPGTHVASDATYAFGIVELGNDGNKAVEKWMAEVRFPKTAKVLSTAVEGARGTNKVTVNADNLLQLHYADELDILNPGDRLRVQYMYTATDPGAVGVVFKGPESTAERREARVGQSVGYSLLSLISSVFCLGFCVFYLWQLTVVKAQRKKLEVGLSEMKEFLYGDFPKIVVEATEAYIKELPKETRGPMAEKIFKRLRERSPGREKAEKEQNEKSGKKHLSSPDSSEHGK